MCRIERGAFAMEGTNRKNQRTVRVGDRLVGAGQPPIRIAGPCAVESRSQMLAIARLVAEAGADMLRGGVFKPRTSPYDFQGLGWEGLAYLREAGDKTGLPIVTEVVDPADIGRLAEQVDLIQIGSRNMYNYALLKALGSAGRPVLLKRGMSATLKEWRMAAAYIEESGNRDIILCERGIRTFAEHTRNTLDLAAVPAMKQLTGLPVVVDPSHGTGIRELIVPMTRAALAAGADGVMVEVHHQPDKALSDGAQSLDPEGYREWVAAFDRIADACAGKG